MFWREITSHLNPALGKPRAPLPWEATFVLMRTGLVTRPFSGRSTSFMKPQFQTLQEHP